MSRRPLYPNRAPLRETLWIAFWTALGITTLIAAYDYSPFV